MKTGVAIALAWPHTYCKQCGDWYDGLASWLRISKGRYYKVGHAAVILIDFDSKKPFYFDFGRYHAPYKYGRVRSSETDHELAMATRARFDEKGLITNLKEILSEIQNNPACHGEGILYAAYGEVEVERCFEKVKEFQNRGMIPYNPFQIGKLNCSRFVNKVIKKGKPNRYSLYKLKYAKPFTPTPMNNVDALPHKTSVEHRRIPIRPKYTRKELEKILYTTQSEPLKPDSVPDDAQWLSGEGAGSWFDLKLNETTLSATRYSEKGTVECQGQYQSKKRLSNYGHSEWKVTYPSDCSRITITNGHENIKFVRSSPSVKTTEPCL